MNTLNIAGKTLPSRLKSTLPPLNVNNLDREETTGLRKSVAPEQVTVYT